MESVRFSAGFTHTEKTVRQLYGMRERVYEKPRMLLRLLLGTLFVGAAVASALPGWARVPLLALGCWLLVSRDFRASLRADRALEERRAVLPRMDYVFYEDRLRLAGEGEMDIPYERISRLIEDEEQLYLFLSRDAACMIPRACVEGGDAAALQAFLAERTGLEWRREKSLLGMNLRDLAQSLRDARTKK